MPPVFIRRYFGGCGQLLYASPLAGPVKGTGWMNMRNVFLLGAVLLLVCGGAGAASGDAADVSLVDVGPYRVTVSDLKSAISASPFATQFVSMDANDQATLRGDLLRRLVISRLLRLEAEAQSLDRTPDFLKEIENFRRGLLYRGYMDRMRERIALPDEELQEIRASTEGNADAFEALRATRVAQRYRAVRRATLESLIKARHVVVYADRIDQKTAPDTVLMEGDGLRITLRDLSEGLEVPQHPNPEWIREQLFKLGELMLVSDAAAAAGLDVEDRVERYRDERLPAILLERKEAEWVPDDDTLKAYFSSHPEIGHVAERRHIGMLVTPSYAQANAMRKRILNGESLFRLAGLYSVDPYGRAHNGDMGWVREGSGMPEIEQAIAGLQDNQISNIVKTPKGYNIVTIIERKPGEDRPLAGVRDKVRQTILNEKLSAYVHGLEGRYKVSWNLAELPPADKAAGQ